MLRTTVFAVLMGVLIAAVPASAMEITAFDRLLQADQSRYVELLINGAKSILREQRNNEMIVKMNTAFDAPPAASRKASTSSMTIWTPQDDYSGRPENLFMSNMPCC